MMDAYTSTLAKLLCSGNRTDIALRLLDGPCQVRDLPGSSTPPKIRSMEPLMPMIIERDGHFYQLTGPGRAYVLAIRDMLDMEEVFRDPFWSTHDLSSIPEKLLKRIGDLKGGTVVKPNNDILKAQVNFVDILTHAKRICGASSFSLPEYPDMITEALGNGAEIDLILSPSCIQALRQGDIFAWQATGRFRMHVREVKAALAVADDTLSLGLFDFAGLYDPLHDYVCQSREAAEWGRELFRYYLEG